MRCLSLRAVLGLLTVLLLLSLWPLLAPPAREPVAGAQESCSPRPAPQVAGQPDGTVTVTSAVRLVEVWVWSGANALVQAPYDAYATAPNRGIYPTTDPYTIRFRVLAQDPAQLVDYLPLRVVDDCFFQGAGPWNTFVGWGSALRVPTAIPSPTPTAPPPTPTATATPLPTVPPTPLPAGSPTIVPSPTPTGAQVRVLTEETYPGGQIEVAWARVSPAAGSDYIDIALVRDPARIAVRFYTSSCGPSPGPVARGGGACIVTLPQGLLLEDHYAILYYAGRTHATTSAPFTVTTIGALLPRDNAKFYSVRFGIFDAGICGCPYPEGGGYVGAEALVHPLTSSWPIAEPSGTLDASLIGLANNYWRWLVPPWPQGWAEVGIARDCKGRFVTSAFCDHNPFLSVGDYLGLRYFYLHTDIDASVPSLFKVYSLGNGWWTGEHCGPYGQYLCWPLWSRSPWPEPPLPTDLPAPAYVNGFLFVHNGQETYSSENEEPLGGNTIRGMFYCCNRWPYWDPWPCDPFAMVVDTFRRTLRRERTCSVDGAWNYDTRY